MKFVSKHHPSSFGKKDRWGQGQTRKRKRRYSFSIVYNNDPLLIYHPTFATHFHPTLGMYLKVVGFYEMGVQ
jgi:hypothetical protein